MNSRVMDSNSLPRLIRNLNKNECEMGIVIAELEMDSKRSLGIFEFKNNLIYRERECYDDRYWLADSQDESSKDKTIKQES